MVERADVMDRRQSGLARRSIYAGKEQRTVQGTVNDCLSCFLLHRAQQARSR